MPRPPFKTPGLFARLTSPTGQAVAVLVGITLAFYHGLWLPGLVLIKRDAFRFFLPLKQYLYERLASGELPQWFPYEGLGRSFIGVTHTGVFHPLTALYFLFSVPNAYRAATLLSCLLAALGAFALGRMLNLSRAGSLIAGVSFALSGYVVSLTDNLLYLYSLCVLPLFCAALERALNNGGAWTVAPAVIWATVLLNGDVQTGYYFGFIALLWALTRAPGLHRTSLRLVLVLCLAGLLAGIQLGPAWDVFMGSERARPALFHSQSLDWSTHPLRLATVLASPVGATMDPVVLARFFFGTPKAGFWAESLYLGVPMAGLALLGTWYRRDLKVMVLLGSLALLLSLGRFGGLYDLAFHTVPLWSAFRYPEKLMGIASFSAAMLAGAGADALRHGKGPLTPWLAAAVLFLAVGGGLRTEAAGAWATGIFGAPADLARAVTSSAAWACWFSAAAAAGVGVAAAGLRHGALRPRLLLAALVAILALDLSRANLGAYHTAPVEAATFMPTLARALQEREGPLAPGRFRMLSIHEDVLVWPQELMLPLGYHGAASVERRQALDHEHNAQFRLESVLPYLSGYSSTFAETLNPRSGIEAAARLNVAYYIGRRYHLKDPRLAKGLVAELPPYDLALFQNPVPAKSRAYLSLKPERTAAPVNPAALLARPDFLSGAVDVIETSDATVPGPAQEGLAVIERYDHEDVRVRVETPQPAVLILLDAYEQGWTATLDGGAELPLLRANALVRAVVVPAGRHVVAFSYQTPLLKAGAWASLTGVLLCLGLIAHARRRARVNGLPRPAGRTIDT
jgi:hypothetical protein